MAFFTAVGIIVSVLFALLLPALFLAGWKLRRNIKQLTTMVDAGLPVAPPARVHAHRREKIVWNDEANANRFLQNLWRLGFQDAGSYEFAELAGVKVRALARPEEHLWALVYEHPKAGVWMEFVTRYAEGGALTTSNSRHGEELEQRPGQEKIYAPELSAEELYQRHLTARRTVPYQEVVPENFVREFEKAYADEMDWRLVRGGVTDSEIRAIAAKSGLALTDQELLLMQQARQSQTSISLSEAIRERFLEQATFAAAEWEKIRDEIVIIHERMAPEEVFDAFVAWSFTDDDFEEEEKDEAPTYPEGLTPRRGFEYLNSTLPAARRFQKIADLNEPVPATIYRASDLALGD